MESLNPSSGVSVSGFNFASPPPPWALKKCLPPLSKTVKFSSSFNIQLEKCSAPPSTHLEKCLAPPANAEIGCASSIAWSLTVTASDTKDDATAIGIKATATHYITGTIETIDDTDTTIATGVGTGNSWY